MRQNPRFLSNKAPCHCQLSINPSAFYNVLLFYCNNLHLYHSGHMQPKSAFHFTHFCLRQCIAFSCMLCRFSLLDVLLRSRRLNHIKGQSPLLLERSFFSGCLEGYISYIYNIYVIHACTLYNDDGKYL